MRQDTQIKPTQDRAAMEQLGPLLFLPVAAQVVRLVLKPEWALVLPELVLLVVLGVVQVGERRLEGWRLQPMAVREVDATLTKVD